VIAGGRYLSRPLFRYVADANLREVFTATTLMLVIGIAALMSLVGLSPALGTFIAGVVLANSEFRHELETDLEPFKGLLLGLFFITVGAGINFSVLTEQLLVVLGITLGIMVIKAGVLYGLARLFGIQNSHRWLVTLSLAQAGEFGFVLVSFSVQHHVLSGELAQIMSLVVALSMLLSPALFILFEKVLLPRFAEEQEQRDADTIDEQGHVIIAGMGRFGQIVNRLLVSNDIKTTVLDHEAKQIDMQRTLGIKGYYGDATRTDLLHIAGIEDATLCIVAIDDRERAITLVSQLKQRYPHLRILARAFDEGHLYQLRQAGADSIVKETYYSALETGCEALSALGVHPFRSNQIKYTFCAREKQQTELLYHVWLDSMKDGRISPDYSEIFQQQEQLIRDSMKRDRNDGHAATERGWTPPPKGYADEFDS